MQRMKGQGTPVPNGPKDQNYSNPMNSSMATPAPGDQFMSPFFVPSTPYQAFGVGDAAWSNGGEHVQTFLGGYGGQVGYESHNAIDGIFSSGNFGGFNAPGYNYGFQGSGDYNAWGPEARSGNKQLDDYYQRSAYQDDRVKGLEQGVQGISLSDKTGPDSSKDNNGTASVGGPSDTNGSDGCLGGGEASSLGGINQPKKGLSWASVASQPAKSQPSRRRDKTTTSSIVPNRHMDIGTWESKNGGPKPVAPPPAPRPAWEAPRGGSRSTTSTTYQAPPHKVTIQTAAEPPSVSPQAPQQNMPPQQQSQTYPTVPAPNPQFDHAQPPQAPVAIHTRSGATHPQHQNSPPQHAADSKASLSPGMVSASTHSPDLAGSPQDASPSAPQAQEPAGVLEEEDSPTLDDLHGRNEYNPKEIEITADNARFFVIKSYSEDDIHRSIKYEIWCSTEHGNKRLDSAFRERESKGPIYLFFSVNGSGHFCGIAQMISQVDYNSSSSVWAQDKWKGQFRVKWIYVKDVPNNQLRYIRLQNNENKPVTNSRDTQEVPADQGRQVIKIIHAYKHKTSIFDDFFHYEKRQEETEFRRVHQDFAVREDHRGGLPDMNRGRPIDPRMDYRDQREHHGQYHRDYHRGGHGGRGRGGHDRGHDRGGYGGHDRGHDRGGYERGGHDRGGYERGGHERGGHERGGHERGGHERGGHERGGHERGGHERGGHDRGGHERGGHERGHDHHRAHHQHHRGGRQ